MTVVKYCQGKRQTQCVTKAEFPYLQKTDKATRESTLWNTGHFGNENTDMYKNKGIIISEFILSTSICLTQAWYKHK